MQKEALQNQPTQTVARMPIKCPNCKGTGKVYFNSGNGGKMHECKLCTPPFRAITEEEYAVFRWCKRGKWHTEDILEVYKHIQEKHNLSVIPSRLFCREYGYTAWDKAVNVHMGRRHLSDIVGLPLADEELLLVGLVREALFEIMDKMEVDYIPTGRAMLEAVPEPFPVEIEGRTYMVSTSQILNQIHKNLGGLRAYAKENKLRRWNHKEIIKRGEQSGT